MKSQNQITALQVGDGILRFPCPSGISLKVIRDNNFLKFSEKDNPNFESEEVSFKGDWATFLKLVRHFCGLVLEENTYPEDTDIYSFTLKESRE